jgi:GAF domain-containing protein
MILTFLNTVAGKLEMIAYLVAGVVAVSVAWQKLKTYFRRLEFDRLFRLDVDINIILQEGKDTTLCDRLSIFQFHNGGHNVNGRSFVRVSCTHEVVRLGIEPQMQNLKNIFVSQIINWCQPLKEGKKLVFRSVEAEIKDDIIKKMLQEQNIKSVIALPLRVNGTIIGFLTADYCRAEDFGKEDFTQAHDALLQVLGVLQHKLKK